MSLPAPRAPLPLCLAVALLAACAAPPERLAPAPPGPSAAEMARLADLEGREDFSAAAELAGHLADQAASPVADELRLRQVDSLLRAWRIPEAAARLGHFTQPPQGGRAPWFRLLQGELALRQGDPAQALERLELAKAPGTPPSLRRRFLGPRAEALGQVGRPGEQAQTLAELDLLLADHSGRLDNQVRLLRVLLAMNAGALQRLRPLPPASVPGWIDLGLALERRVGHLGAPDADGDWLRPWRLAHPGHPALPALLRHYPLATGEAPPGPRRIAVLLPRQGPYAEAGAALRDGLLAAYYAQPRERRPRLRLHDLSDPARALAELEQAAAEGAEAAIGPLQREAVTTLAAARTLPFPVLALNRANPSSPGAEGPLKHLFQFALDPEEEARQAAEWAYASGARLALALTPAGPWGERLVGAFQDRWRALGGRLAGHQAYGPGAGESERAVRALLGQPGTDRGGRLERLLGQPLVLATTPPVQPAQGLLFLVVTSPAKAREIWPQVRFQGGAGMIAYTTSHGYAGRFDPQQDLDLVGLRFPDLPWLLDQDPRDPLALERLPAPLTARQGLPLRLVAMGMDGYRLLPHLPGLRDFPSARLLGATGELRLGADNQMRRRLSWVHMTAQGPRPLGLAVTPPAAGVSHGPR